MGICLCLEHEHEGPGACTACGDCCKVCGDIASGAAFRRCEHRDFTDGRDGSDRIRYCGVCGGADGEHNWETHYMELRAG